MAEIKGNVAFFLKTKMHHPEDAKLMDAVLAKSISNGAQPEDAMGIIAAHIHDSHMSTVEMAIHGNTPEGDLVNTRVHSHNARIVQDVENDFHSGMLQVNEMSN